MNPLLLIIIAVAGLFAINGGMNALDGVKDFLTPPSPIGFIENSTANVLNISNSSSEVVNATDGGNTSNTSLLPPPARIAAQCYWQQWTWLSWLCPTANKVIDVAEGKTDRSIWIIVVGVVILIIAALILKRMIFPPV